MTSGDAAASASEVEKVDGVGPLGATDASATGSRRRALSFCFITTFYPPASFGGDAVHVRRVAQGLARRGHRVRVVHNPAAYRMLGGRLVDAPDADDGVEVVPVPSGAVATTATYLTGSPTGYERRLADLARGFDVVHFHNPSLLGGPGAFAVGDTEALRLYTTHEHWLLCPTHVLFRYGKEVCEKRTCWRCTLQHHRPPQLWRSTRLLDRAVDHLDVLLAPSRFTAEMHRTTFPRARIELLPPLFWPELPSSDGTVVRPERPFFLFAGRLEPIKGADRLVRAFARVRGADLVVVGGGAQAAELAEVAATNPSVRLTGRLPHNEVLALARSALAVVVPSVGYETFGGVAVEAMALGTAAVVRTLGPLPELVEQGGGLVFGDDEELVVVLQALTDDQSLSKRLSDEAPGAVSRFSTTAFFRRYFAILADVAAARGIQDVSSGAGAAAATELP